MQKRYLIFGGTGSLGKILTKRLLDLGFFVCSFSRDEAKHVEYRKLFPNKKLVQSIMGDIRDYNAVYDAIRKINPHYIIIASALKNIPETEEFPSESIKTNILGTENVLNAADILSVNIPHKLKILFVSTDKACSPVNSYAFCKALGERLTIRKNGNNILTNCVRYGNVLESRGSVIPFFKYLIENGIIFNIVVWI